jgi:hypothetical protein
MEESTGATRFSARRRALVAWELLEFTREAIESLEDGATRIAAAQVAGLIALWTQLSNFESGPPEVLAWLAWALLICSVSLLAPVVTPRRLARFWERTLVKDILTVDSTVKEEQIIESLSATMEKHVRWVRRGMSVSVAIGLVALGLAALAFVLEKAFYAP